MNKIAIIIPYFGKWPEWMDLYLFSASIQKNIDFLFFTNCEIPTKVYKNTIFHKTDYKSYCKRISTSLNINFSSENKPYKLCDCRPFYGIIHKKELQDYEFWGFGDIDLIYGDLSLIINDSNLIKYNFISAHSDRISGHFSIMRNIKQYNNICYKINNWKEKLESEHFYSLDESRDYGYLINPSKRLVDIAYSILFKFIYKKGVYRYYDKANRLTKIFHPKILFKERYTTPVPQKNSPYIYDMKSHQILVPKDQWYKMSPDGGKSYLHFLFF